MPNIPVTLVLSNLRFDGKLRTVRLPIRDIRPAALERAARVTYGSRFTDQTVIWWEQ